MLTHSNLSDKNRPIHGAIASYTPQQNGIADRKSMTFIAMMNVMLISSGLPDNMWAEAILSACHILNKVSHKKLDKLPMKYGKDKRLTRNTLKCAVV